MSEMTFDKMVQQMTPDIYESLKQAVSLRKWPDGRVLSAEQVELCLEAVIKYEAEHGVSPEEESPAGAAAAGVAAALHPPRAFAHQANE